MNLLSFVIGFAIGYFMGIGSVLAYAWFTGESGSRSKPTPRITAPIEEKVERLYRSAPHPNMDSEPTRVRRALFRQRSNYRD